MDKEIVGMSTKNGKKKRARQDRRWRDGITSYIGTAWARVVVDRKVQTNSGLTWSR